MHTKLKINVPKGFYENKVSVTPSELMGMILEFMAKAEKMEKDLTYELETEFKAIHENARLKERIKQLEEQLKNKGE
ncbi:MAG TPA: hypothetical protein GX707_20910 [Epulopiscium sp.]|nr:hypothetical protein [Candidatus Epulonipiscium sp.]